jgi:hypothetical protein
VAATPVIRLFDFQPTRPAFDNVLRDWIVPALCRQPGIVDVYAGRHGPDELGPRLIVSIWESPDAMDRAFGPSDDTGALQPETLDGMVERHAEVLSAEVAFRADSPVGPPRIIRVLRGSARPGQLARYIEEARAGLSQDVAAGHGPIAFYLGLGPLPASFVALSVWTSWEAIELATGGDIRQPMATRRPELIASFEATHFEAIDL